MKKQWNHESGRSMLEMLAVLALAAVLTLGGIRVYENTATKVNASDLMDEISTIATKNRMELLHSEHVSRKEIKTPKGAVITTTKGENEKYSFQVEVTSINEDLCHALAKTNLLTQENSLLAGINDDECPGRIVFYFQKDFSDEGEADQALNDSSNDHSISIGGGSVLSDNKNGKEKSNDGEDSTQCTKDFYLYNKVCVECPEHCVCDGKIILGAEKGYYKEGRVCKECGPNVLRCNGDKALTCVDNYYLKDGECLKCPDNSTTTEYSHQRVDGTSCYCKFGYRLNEKKNGCVEGCETSSDCPENQPACREDKKCGACQSNYGGEPNSCPSEFYPECKNGECKSCPSGKVWNVLAKSCTICSSDDLRFCPSDKPYCDNVVGVCAECLSDKHCPLGKTCAEDSTCKDCTAHSFCGSCAEADSNKTYWDGKKCAACTSKNTSSCPSAYPYCDEDAGSCIQCFADYGANVGGCKSKEKPVCDVNSHTCQACPDKTPFWNGQKCVACWEDTHCPLGKICTEDSTCKDCTAHSFCGSCAEADSNKTYWDGKKCAACTSKNTSSCPPEYPYCDEDAGSCIQCLADYGAQVGGCKDEQKPLCDVGSHTCHACPETTPFWNGQKCVALKQCLGPVTECGSDALGFMYKGHLYCYNTHEEFVKRCREAVPYTTSCHNGHCFYAGNYYNEDFSGNCHWGYFDIQDINNWCASKKGSRISQSEMVEIWDAFMECNPSFGKHNEACYWTNTNACRMKNGNWNNARNDGYINAGGGICKIY